MLSVGSATAVSEEENLASGTKCSHDLHCRLYDAIVKSGEREQRLLDVDAALNSVSYQIVQ
jgi:hypothetical protein